MIWVKDGIDGVIMLAMLGWHFYGYKPGGRYDRWRNDSGSD